MRTILNQRLGYLITLFSQIISLVMAPKQL